MTKRKPTKTKPRKTGKPRLMKPGVATGEDGRARTSRRKAITAELKKMQGTAVRNAATGREVKIVKASISETANHASKSPLSTIAALDAKRQIREAKPVRTTKPKNNRRQQEMRINKMTIMKGKLLTAETKVLTGETTKGNTVLYSITAKQRKKKK